MISDFWIDSFEIESYGTYIVEAIQFKNGTNKTPGNYGNLNNYKFYEKCIFIFTNDPEVYNKYKNNYSESKYEDK